MTADIGGPYSTLSASRPGKRVSRRFKSSPSLRVYCRSPKQSTLRKVGIFPFPKGEGLLILCSFLQRPEYNIQVGDDISPRERYVLQSAGN